MAKSKSVVPQASSSKTSTTTSKPKVKATPTAASASNTSTSIDDIFAKPAGVSSKAAGKAKAVPVVEEKKPSKPKVKKTSKTSERVVETVLDPSAVQVAAAAPVEKVKKRDRAELDDEEAFRDSRGEGPREFTNSVDIISQTDMYKGGERKRVMQSSRKQSSRLILLLVVSFQSCLDHR